MKMGKLEKLFVNSPSRSRQVGLHAERLLNLIDFKAGQTYLDVGCGNGTAPIHLAQKFHLDVTGIDVDPAQIRLAEEQSKGLDKAQFLTIEGTQLPFEDGQFDIVWSSEKPIRPVPYPISRSQSEWNKFLDDLYKGWGKQWANPGNG